MSISNQLKRNIFADTSLWFLLLSNIITIFFAINENWSLSTIIWIYWFQSITIGFFNFIRILCLKEFSTEGFKINGISAKPTQSTKVFTAFFFLFHYGFFHVVYAIFLLFGAFSAMYGENSILGTFSAMHGNSPDATDLKYIFLTAMLFFINHLFSYIYNRPRDTKKQNIGSLMFYPYVRIIPMHIIIMISFSSGSSLFFFLMLKTFADIAMHIVEHDIIRKGEMQQV